MAKDPAFLFYPGDYLRDTQCLSENTQVSYDRIMCEHMRNICISKKQLKFFTRRLSEDELEELLMVLTEVDGGYEIQWVSESILKRRAYSESRRNNRTKNTKKDNNHMNNISSTYDKHMENENEDVNEGVIKSEKLLELWNRFASHHSLQKINKLTKTRLKQLSVRNKEKEFILSSILTEAQKQPFCLGIGQKDRETPWKIDFDWIIKNDTNYIKVIEGKYGSEQIQEKMYL